MVKYSRRSSWLAQLSLQPLEPQVLVIDRELEEWDVHLVVGLLAEDDLFVRIGIVRIGRRVVVVTVGGKGAACLDPFRFGKLVDELPLRVVTGNAEQRLLFPIRRREHEGHVLAAVM